MILCRNCSTRHDDDATVCTECGRELVGANRLSLGTAIDTSAPETIAPVAAPPPNPIDGPPVDSFSSRADRAPSVPTPSEPAPAPFTPEPRGDTPQNRSSLSASERPRRGRRPGEERLEEPEPDTNSFQPAVDSRAPADAPVEAEPSPPPPVAPARPEVIDGAPNDVESQPSVQTAGAGVRPADGHIAVEEGEVRCDQCRRPNSMELRFCRTCGERLPTFGIEPDLDAEEQSDSLFRRVLGTARKGDQDSRTFSQRMRDSGQRKLKYRAKHTLKTRLQALGFIGGGMAGIILMLGPVRKNVENLLNPPDPIPVESVATKDTPAVAEQFAANLARDGDPKTAFALPWNDEPVEFAITVPIGNIRKIVFTTGFPYDDLDRASTFLRPAEVEISAGDGLEPLILELGDHDGEQRFDFDFDGDPTELNIKITKVHETNWDTYPRVAIAEIAVVK